VEEGRRLMTPFKAAAAPRAATGVVVSVGFNPTFWEKLTWANGDGSGLRVVETRLGRIGMLICGENTNPLARFTWRGGEDPAVAGTEEEPSGPA